MVTFGTEMMGSIYVTNSLEFVKTVPDGTVKIISLDEDGALDPNAPNIVLGTCLLPPVECLIAEADGDEGLYNMYYVDYLNTPAPQQFIAAVIGSLYRRNNLLLYAPQMNENNSIRKLREFMWDLYGIGIGIVGDPNNGCRYDARCIPIWLTMMYRDNIIDCMEFLYDYPENADINPANCNKIIQELKPIGDTYEDKIKEIKRLQKSIKGKPTVIYPLYDIRS